MDASIPYLNARGDVIDPDGMIALAHVVKGSRKEKREHLGGNFRSFIHSSRDDFGETLLSFKLLLHIGGSGITATVTMATLPLYDGRVQV